MDSCTIVGGLEWRAPFLARLTRHFSVSGSLSCSPFRSASYRLNFADGVSEEWVAFKGLSPTLPTLTLTHTLAPVLFWAPVTP
jgi:hypothetical protein